MAADEAAVDDLVFEGSPDRDVAEAVGRGNAVVFLDIAIGGTRVGRMKLELFSTITPRVRRTRCSSALKSDLHRP
jgi:hypothetical protein